MTQIRVWDRLRHECPDGCHGRRLVYTGEVLSGGEQDAVFWVFLYDHDGYREVYTRVAVGGLGDGGEILEARTGPLDPDDRYADVASTFVDPLPEPDDRVVRLVTAEEARSHPQRDAFWLLHDDVHDAIPEVSAHLAGRPTIGRGQRLRRFRGYTVEAASARR